MPFNHNSTQKCCRKTQDPTLRSLNTSPDQECCFSRSVYLRSQNCRWVTIPSVDIVQPFCTENISTSQPPQILPTTPKVSIMVSPFATFSPESSILYKKHISFPQEPCPQVFIKVFSPGKDHGPSWSRGIIKDRYHPRPGLEAVVISSQSPSHSISTKE